MLETPALHSAAPLRDMLAGEPSGAQWLVVHVIAAAPSAVVAEPAVMGDVLKVVAAQDLPSYAPRAAATLCIASLQGPWLPLRLP